MAFKIRFIDYPKSTSVEKSIFLGILRDIGIENLLVIRSENERVDLEVASNFVNNNFAKKAIHRLAASFSTSRMLEYEVQNNWGYRIQYKTESSKRIWFTGENLRAPVDVFDSTFSCDASDYLIRNTFFPYWFYRLNWGFGDTGFEIQPSPDELALPRKLERRPQTACSFSGSHEPTRRKVNLGVSNAVSLSKFGRAEGNTVKSKLDTSRNYGFQVCTENDLYPNYVTEKLVEAWVAGNVPIWSGLDDLGFFNKAAIIDVTGKSTEEIADVISSISLDEAAHIRSQPLLHRKPNLSEIKNAIQKTIEF